MHYHWAPRSSSSSAEDKEASQSAIEFIRATYRQRQKKREQVKQAQSETKSRAPKVPTAVTLANADFETYRRPFYTLISPQNASSCDSSDDSHSEDTSMTSQSSSNSRADFNHGPYASEHTRKARDSFNATPAIDLSKTLIWQIRRHQKEKHFYNKMVDLERNKPATASTTTSTTATRTRLEQCEASVMQHEVVEQSLWDKIKREKSAGKAQRVEGQTKLPRGSNSQARSSRRSLLKSRYRPY